MDTMSDFGIIVEAIGTRRQPAYREPVTGETVLWGTAAEAARKLALPYVVARDQDGREIVMHRRYQPIWTRDAAGQVARVQPGTVRTWTDARWLYNDGTPEPQKVAAARQVCAEWGIELPERLADLVVQGSGRA